MTARLATHRDVALRVQDVRQRLVAAGVEVELVTDETRGNGVCDPLQGVRDGTLDLALVGIGALRGSAADGLTTVAVLPREELRDVLVALGAPGAPLADLPPGARVGVHGARCRALLRAHRPDLEPHPLARSDGVGLAGTDDLDAAVLGTVEARQAGLVDRIAESLDPRAWLPEPGKGALALVARHPIAEATALDHLPTRTALRAELALVDGLGLGPDSSLGSFAQTTGRWIRLWAAVTAEDGSRIVRSDATGPLDEPETLGTAVARQIRERGMEVVLAGAADTPGAP